MVLQIFAKFNKRVTVKYQRYEVNFLINVQVTLYFKHVLNNLNFALSHFPVPASPTMNCVGQASKTELLYRSQKNIFLYSTFK